MKRVLPLVLAAIMALMLAAPFTVSVSADDPPEDPIAVSVTPFTNGESDSKDFYSKLTKNGFACRMPAQTNLSSGIRISSEGNRLAALENYTITFCLAVDAEAAANGWNFSVGYGSAATPDYRNWFASGTLARYMSETEIYWNSYATRDRAIARQIGPCITSGKDVTYQFTVESGKLNKIVLTCDGIVWENTGYQIDATVGDFGFTIDNPNANRARGGVFKTLSVTTASETVYSVDFARAYCEEAIRLNGYQTKKMDGAGSYDVRFVADIKQELVADAQKVSFAVSASYTDSEHLTPVAVLEKSFDTYTVYEKILADGEPVNAADDYCFALFDLTEIPEDVAVTFSVTPRITDQNGTVYNGKTVVVALS